MQLHRFGSMPIFESVVMTKPFEDWSEVRSPSRARRRLKRGFPQRIRYVQIPDPQLYVFNGAVHGHPETVKKLLALAKEAAA